MLRLQSAAGARTSVRAAAASTATATKAAAKLLKPIGVSRAQLTQLAQGGRGGIFLDLWALHGSSLCGGTGP